MHDLKVNVVKLLDKFLPICEILIEISTQVDKSSDYWARDCNRRYRNKTHIF